MINRASIVLVLLLGGCEPTPDVKPEDVIRLETCVDQEPCKLVADGASSVSVRACVPEAVKVRASSLDVTLQVSSGTWLAAGNDAGGNASTTSSLSGNQCVTRWFQTGTRPGVTRVTATLAGVEVAETVTLRGAPITAIEVLPVPQTLNDTGVVALTAQLRSEGSGKPSEGTTVEFSVVSTTPGRAANVYPLTTVADAAGKAQATVVTAKDVTSLTVRVTATPLATPEEPAPPSKSVELVVSAPTP